jgi:hypothetical protein
MGVSSSANSASTTSSSSPIGYDDSITVTTYSSPQLTCETLLFLPLRLITVLQVLRGDSGIGAMYLYVFNEIFQHLILMRRSSFFNFEFFRFQHQLRGDLFISLFFQRRFSFGQNERGKLLEIGYQRWNRLELNAETND